MYFPAHLIHGPNAPRPAPKPALRQSSGQAADVSLHQFECARNAGAMCLSSDGKVAYRRRMGQIERCFWDDEAGNYQSWWALPDVEDWPGDSATPLKG